MPNYETKTPPVVVITGATAGVGRATVRKFAKNGASIGLLARDTSRLKKTREEVEKIGGRALGVSVDVASASDVEKAAKKIEQKLGPIDIWINNAMSTVFSPIHKITPEEFRRATEVTYLGTVHGTQTALKRMRKKNKGTIVQVGSALSYRAIPLQAAYCGAKHAIRAFTDSLRAELLHDNKNIYLTMVQLPALNTPQFTWSTTHILKHPQPVPPIFQPEVAADAIYWAAFHKRREVWVGGSTVATIIMNKFFPQQIDKYLAQNGYDSQMINKAPTKNIPGNLFQPVRGDFAAHGVFGNKSKKHSLQFKLEKIPLIHSITNIVTAIATAATMMPRYFKK